ncbi:FAD-binding reductase [Caballeronia hypogeia]|uniref:FAD-binding reductase n=1 Tax=Caballeronia hypogeia TaxID=1777140 RepID=A0A158BTT2_9BURK|nr:hypothetical protein [Caballeronia hypogeia]SAK73518.1 FAD-binding reductase [Caballeronia hypogeia]
MNARQLELVVEHVADRRAPLEGAHDWHVLVVLADTQGAADMEAALQATLEEAVEAGLIEDAIVANAPSRRCGA